MGRSLKNRSITVVGDVILDEYTHGQKLGISAETPTVVATFDRTERFVGGAGLVVRNLLRLGAHVRLLTVGGDDRLIERFLGYSDPITAEELSRLSYDPLVGDGWKWTEKRRFYVDSYKMVQYDIINPAPYVPKIQEKIKEAYVRARNETDAVVVCDNRHGTMMHELIDLVVQKKSRYGGKLFVDSQVSQHGSNHSFYRGADMMFLNGKELDSIPQSRLVADDLMRKLKVVSNSLQSGVTLKRGEKGSATFFPSEDYVESPAYPVKAVDTCGAGDAFLAAYAVSEDLGFANRWAGLSTTYYGTVVPQQET